MNQKLIEAEALQENYLIPNSLYDGKYTKTSQFMTPAIDVNVSHKLVFKFFENAFLADRGHAHNYTRPIFLLFSIKDYKDLDWKRVYSILIQSPNYIAEYDVGIKSGKYLFMMVFSVPEEFKGDYLHFRNGKYSLFSDNYKKKFPKYLDKEKKKKNTHWQIINKDKDLKRQVIKDLTIKEDALGKEDEIWDMPRVEREFYRFKIEKNEKY